ncbi:MAG: hypothetical protein LC796_09230, partial [Acidobacteria bacterium]|nr:hypothetical protein [Acidobacteriota bacterium]
MAEPRFRTVIVGLFAAAALLLASTALYGVVAYGSPGYEIGPGMAMGATPRETLRLVAVEACVSPAPGSCSGLSERSRPRALCGTPLRGRSQDP